MDFWTDHAGFDALFSGGTEVRRIVSDLELYLGRHIGPSADVLVFDEVQLCDKALNSLSFFAESDYRVLAMGSPLGIRISARQFGREGALKSVPLYAAFCVETG